LMGVVRQQGGGERTGTGSLKSESAWHSSAPLVYYLEANEWATSGLLHISIRNNLILSFTYVLEPKPLPKSEYNFIFGRPP
jgi:hypothetical protein